jgi:cytochrome P450
VDQFKPERFLSFSSAEKSKINNDDEEEEEQSMNEKGGHGVRGLRHPFAFLPFSAGLRTCVGHKFANIEMKIVLSMILRQYKVQLSENFQLEFAMHPFIRPKAGLKLKFIPRN